VQQILWQTSPLQLHSHSLPPSGTQRWKLDAARAFVAVANPGTATLTSAPANRRSTRRRGIGLAIDRASSSRNAVKSGLRRLRADHST